MPMLPKINMVCVDVRDVARAHINAITIPEAAGNRHITATQNAWFSEIATVCVLFYSTMIAFLRSLLWIFFLVIKPKDSIVPSHHLHLHSRFSVIRSFCQICQICITVEKNKEKTYLWQDLISLPQDCL